MFCPIPNSSVKEVKSFISLPFLPAFALNQTDACMISHFALFGANAYFQRNEHTLLSLSPCKCKKKSYPIYKFTHTLNRVNVCISRRLHILFCLKERNNPLLDCFLFQFYQGDHMFFSDLLQFILPHASTYKEGQSIGLSGMYLQTNVKKE